LLRILPRNIAPDVILFIGNHLALLLEGAFLAQSPLRPLDHECFITSAISDRTSSFQMENMIDHTGQKCAVVTDQQDCFLCIPQVLLQPARRLQVEMIRRLVEKQDIGSAHQLARQPEPAALSTAQLLERLCSRFLRIKAESLQHRVHSGSEGISPFPVEPLEVAIVPAKHLRRSGLTNFCQHVGLF
jgi:hypothetical protein